MKTLVTGGGGFLGKALSFRLKERGYEVRSIARNDYPELRDRGIETVRGDIADKDAVIAAAQGCQAVFHTAAKAGIWGSYEDFYRTNVTGTANVIEACQVNKISKLIFTSSPSVIHAGKDIEGSDESLPYPKHFSGHYPTTKALAEQLVLKANCDSLKTVALRPHLIWGPGDNHVIPHFIARARSGKLRLIGGPTKLVDTVYIDNAVEAHILALEKLMTGASCAGKPYFITQGEPIPVNDFVNRVLACAGMEPVKKSIAPWVVHLAGGVLEMLFTITRRSDEPVMTRGLANHLTTSHWFSIEGARRDLGYVPGVDLNEGMRRLTTYLTEISEKSSPSTKPVKGR